MQERWAIPTLKCRSIGAEKSARQSVQTGKEIADWLGFQVSQYGILVLEAFAFIDAACPPVCTELPRQIHALKGERQSLCVRRRLTY